MIPVGENAIYKLAARYVAVIAIVLTACHYLGAAPAVVVVLAGCGVAFANKDSVVFQCLGYLVQRLF